jgi:integrase
MARKVKKVTPFVVKHLKRGFYLDPECSGLYLQISKVGTQSYVFRYKSPITRRQRWMGLGGEKDVSLAVARELAAAAREQVKLGNDPLLEKDAALTAAREAYARDMASRMTFTECCTQYLDTHLKTFRNEKHRKQWQASLTRACKAFGNVPVNDIGRDMMFKFLSPIWTATPESGSRIRGRIEAVLDWAHARGFRTGDNVASWKLLKHLLAKKPEAKHHNALPFADIPAFMGELRERQSTSARALEFLILTATRTGETIGARWDEIEGSTWTIPGERTKSGRPHRVPLSSRALEIVNNMPRVSEFVFANGGGLPLSNMAMLQLLKHMDGGKLTAHGFRSTFKDWASERTNFANHVTEMALSHAVKDKTEAAYRRGDLLVKRVKLMQSWADYCALPVVVETTNVVNIRA